MSVPPYAGVEALIPERTRQGPLIAEATIQSYPHEFEQAITTSGGPGPELLAWDARGLGDERITVFTRVCQNQAGPKSEELAAG